MSGRRDALQVLWTRVTQIRTTNGYNTDAGARVFMGETPTLGPSDPVASIAIVVREDELAHEGEDLLTVLPVEVQAIVKIDANDPDADKRASNTLEETIEDIKRAVEQDHDLGKTLIQRGLARGSTKPLEREEGSEFVGAAVQYRLSIKERWGTP